MKNRKFQFISLSILFGILLGTLLFLSFLSISEKLFKNDLYYQNKEWKETRLLSPYNMYYSSPFDSLEIISQLEKRMINSIDNCVQDIDGYYRYKIFGIDGVEWDVFSISYYDSNKGLVKYGSVHPTFIYSKTPISSTNELKTVLFESLKSYYSQYLKGFKEFGRIIKEEDKRPVYKTSNILYDLSSSQSNILTNKYIKLNDMYIQYRDKAIKTTKVTVKTLPAIILYIISLALAFFILFLFFMMLKNKGNDITNTTKSLKYLYIISSLLFLICIPWIICRCSDGNNRNELFNSTFDNFINENYPLLKYSSLGLISLKESELDVLERNYDSYAPNTSLALIKNNLENSQWYHDNFFKFEVNLVPFVSALGKQSLPYPKDGKNRKTTYNEYIEICQLLSELNKTSIFNVHNEEEAQTFIYNCDSLCHNLGLHISEHRRPPFRSIVGHFPCMMLQSYKLFS